MTINSVLPDDRNDHQHNQHNDSCVWEVDADDQRRNYRRLLVHLPYLDILQV